jgi:hypothetical protein
MFFVGHICMAYRIGETVAKKIDLYGEKKSNYKKGESFLINRKVFVYVSMYIQCKFLFIGAFSVSWAKEREKLK